MSEHPKGKLHRHGLEIHIERSESGKIVEHTCIANMNDTMNLPIVSNANHLLKCWNSHDALLAACKLARYNEHKTWSEIQPVLDAAIAAAKEE